MSHNSRIAVTEERARMSEAASVPFSETKAPESPDRLHKGALRLIDISA
jgi:hypothetical protein